MYQSLVNNVPIDWSLLVKNVPEAKQLDLDYIISMLDWEANTVPNVKEAYFRPPLPVKPIEEMESEGCLEKWITYGNEYARQRIDGAPGRTVIVAIQGRMAIMMQDMVRWATGPLKHQP
jgi:hypothetical protein